LFLLRDPKLDQIGDVLFRKVPRRLKRESALSEFAKAGDEMSHAVRLGLDGNRVRGHAGLAVCFGKVVLKEFGEFFREPLWQPGVVQQCRKVELDFHSCRMKSDVLTYQKNVPGWLEYCTLCFPGS
jgi:hypothetical protein